MTLIDAILIAYLIIAALAICIMRRLLASMIIFASFGVVMSVVWVMLAAPDLAITEAAVGTGISGILFFVVLKRIRVIEDEHTEEKEKNKRAG